MRIQQVISFLLAAVLPAGLAAANDPYTRVTDHPDGSVVLEMATRTFKPDSPDRPRVHLVSAIHIADAPYYDAMQALLETYDTVLYEGVKPAGLDPIDPDLEDPARVEATRDRLRLLVQIASQYHAAQNAFPDGFQALANAEDKRIAAIVESIRDDAWGNRFVMDHSVSINDGQQTSRVVFTSYGADAKPGGEGINADLSDATEVVGSDESVQTPEGIQTQLANALRVEFQLDAMDTTNPDWVNADMDINQLQHALSEYGDDSLAILDLLEGQSISAKIAGFVLGFISRSPQLSSMMKLVMMDMLALAEQTDIIAQQEVMHAVIVEGRNQVVIDYLKKTIDEHPNHDDIGIFYGAGHMPGLEQSLIEMGYQPAEDHWTPAMTVNPSDTGLSETQVRMMRNMIKSSLQQQMGR